jgi:hypothetical protein
MQDARSLQEWLLRLAQQATLAEEAAEDALLTEKIRQIHSRSRQRLTATQGYTQSFACLGSVAVGGE